MMLDTQLGRSAAVTRFSDFRDVDGIKFPFKMVQRLGELAGEFRFTNILTNVAMNDEIFRKPATD